MTPPGLLQSWMPAWIPKAATPRFPAAILPLRPTATAAPPGGGVAPAATTTIGVAVGAAAAVAAATACAVACRAIVGFARRQAIDARKTSRSATAARRTITPRAGAGQARRAGRRRRG